MTCAEFQNRTSAYLDGELSHWTRWKVDNHLRHCPECADCLHDFQDLDLLVAESVIARPEPAHLTYSVITRLPAMPPAWRRRALRPVMAGAALACAQVLALGGAYWWGFNQAGTDGGGRATGGAVPSNVARGSGGPTVPVTFTHATRAPQPGNTLAANTRTVPMRTAPVRRSQADGAAARVVPLWGMSRFNGLSSLTVPASTVAGTSTHGPRNDSRLSRPARGSQPSRGSQPARRSQPVMVPAGAH